MRNCLKYNDFSKNIVFYNDFSKKNGKIQFFSKICKTQKILIFYKKKLW